MKSAPDQNSARGETGRCLARSVAATLVEEPGLEAVTIDRAQKKISVATLGRADVPRLTERITAEFQAAQSADAGHVCSLLTGEGDCFSCATPLPESDRNRITIRHEGVTTTIARVTCPTAPNFWRWRDIPFPKIAPREIELDEDEEHINEWKWQLALAITCGAFGLLAAFVFPAARIPLFMVELPGGRVVSGRGSLGTPA